MPSLHPCELGCVIQLILPIMTDRVSHGVTRNHSLDTVPGASSYQPIIPTTAALLYLHRMHSKTSTVVLALQDC